MALIALTQNQTAIVSDESHKQAARLKWCAKWDHRARCFYAARAIRLPNGKQRQQYLHNFIWELLHGPIPPGYTVDFIDRDTLNNRADNLRLATKSQQGANRRRQRNNTSGFIGVHWHNRSGKWWASARVNGKKKYLGSFDSPFEAAAVRDAFVKQLHGEFAVTNF